MELKSEKLIRENFLLAFVIKVSLDSLKVYINGMILEINIVNHHSIDIGQLIKKITKKKKTTVNIYRLLKKNKLRVLTCYKLH